MLQQDMALVEKWRARRDADAFALIVQRHAALVYATSLRITRNRADAEDIAQECFASLALGKTRIKSSLASWLHKVATHRSLDRLRSDTRRKAREQRSPETESPSDEVSWNDIQSYVDQALAELPEKLRFPLIAHFLEGESYQSIAATLDLPRSTVASRVRKGLELVRQSLERRGVRATAACLNALLAANAIKAVPSALAAALGKYAIAGAGKASVAVGAQSLVGWVLWQKIAVVASLAVALAFGTWTVANYAIDGEAPPRETSAVSAGTADDAAVDLPQEAKEVVSVRETDQAEAEDPAEPTGTPPEATVTVDEPETGGTITGRMYDAETNEPVEGAIAYAYPRRGGSSEGRSARSDAEGRYRITGLADGWYSISPARVAGYPRQSSEMRRTVKVTTDGPVEDVDFAYHPGIRVAGIITSAGGQPMPEVRVGAMVESAGHAENARSQSDGSFEVFVLPRGDRLPRMDSRQRCSSMAVRFPRRRVTSH